MKWIVLFGLLAFSVKVLAGYPLEERPAPQSSASGKLFIKEVRLLLKQGNIDSLEEAFSGFSISKMEQNRLAEGHFVLNKIISDKMLSDTLKIFAYKYKAVLYGQIDLTSKRNAFVSAVRLIRKNGYLQVLLPAFQLEIAKTYLSQSRFSDATRVLNKLDLKVIKDPEKQVEVLGVSGLLYAQMGDTVKAFDQLNTAIKIAERYKDYFGLGTIHSAIGNTTVNVSHDYEKALVHFRSSMNAFQKAGYGHYALGSQTDIGTTYSRIHAHDSAFYYLLKSYDEAKRTGSVYDQSICAKEIGVLYNELDEPEKALGYCKEARNLIWNYASESFRSSCASCLANAYEALNEPDSALHYFKLYHAYRDSTLNKDETKAIAKFNAELEKRIFIAEQEKINLKKDQVLQTGNLIITFLSILSVLLVVLFVLIVRVIRNRKKNELIELKEKNQRDFLKKLLQSLEDERKRLSMELHDSVGQMLIVAGRNSANKQFDLVGPMLQDALNEVRTISQGLHPYILEKMGLHHAILNLIHTTDCSNDMFIESEIDLEGVQLGKDREIHVYRIVQELISNCLKHSQSPSMNIEIRAIDDCLLIHVGDKGIGFDPDLFHQRNKISLGWKTLHERVALLKGTMQIDSKPNNGTSVTIQIPSHDENTNRR